MVKNGFGHSQRSPKEIFKKYSKSGRRDPGGLPKGPSPGPGPRRRGPGTGPGTAPWTRAWARAPLSRPPVFEYFLNMSFGDLWECPKPFVDHFLSMSFWASQNHFLAIIPDSRKWSPKGDMRSIIRRGGARVGQWERPPPFRQNQSHPPYSGFP